MENKGILSTHPTVKELALKQRALLTESPVSGYSISVYTQLLFVVRQEIRTLFICFHSTSGKTQFTDTPHVDGGVTGTSQQRHR
ncbi:hypothetical protein BsWGS_26761 [Bradybaena similaris]